MQMQRAFFWALCSANTGRNRAAVGWRLSDSLFVSGSSVHLKNALLRQGTRALPAQDDRNATAAAVVKATRTSIAMVPGTQSAPQARSGTPNPTPLKPAHASRAFPLTSESRASPISVTSNLPQATPANRTQQLPGATSLEPILTWRWSSCVQTGSPVLSPRPTSPLPPRMLPPQWPPRAELQFPPDDQRKIQHPLCPAAWWTGPIRERAPTPAVLATVVAAMP